MTSPHQPPIETLTFHTLRAHDRIADLQAEAARERLAHSAAAAQPVGPARMLRARFALGRALIAVGRVLAPKTTNDGPARPGTGQNQARVQATRTEA
jgi:hypothetical protein